MRVYPTDKQTNIFILLIYIDYRPLSLLPICGKILEKIIFNPYAYLHTNNLINKNQSGFRPGDSTTNQLLYLLDEIHQAFDSTKSLEQRFLIFLKPLTRYGMMD